MIVAPNALAASRAPTSSRALLLMCGALVVGAAPTPSETVAECGPPLRRTYTLGEAVRLRCNPTGDRAASRVLFDVPLPQQRGVALARAHLRIRHTGITDVIHFWNAQVAVGREQYAMGIGDDVCKGAPPVRRTNFGYGELTNSANHVRVFAYQGANPCVEGAVEILPGSTLDLWLEPGTAGCEGRSIELVSHYLETGFEDRYLWQTHLSPILRRRVDVPADGSLLLMSVVEGSPDVCPNRVCGEETGTLSTELRLDGTVVDAVTTPLPPSQGMGHLVLYNEAERTVTAGSHLVELHGRADFSSSPVRTGGCCGDAAVFIVHTKTRPAAQAPR